MIVFALKYWKLIGVGLGFLVLGIMLASAKGDARHYAKLYLAEQSARALEQAEVRKVRAEQKAEDAEHARNVEQVQTKVSNEVSHEYQTKLADLRGRYDALRLRTGATQAPTSSGGRTDLSGIPDASSGPDAAATAGEDDFNAAANFLQLEALQAWIKGQVAVER